MWLVLAFIIERILVNLGDFLENIILEDIHIDYSIKIVLKFSKNCSSSVSIVTTLWTGRPGFDCRQGLGTFLLATASRLVQGPTQPPIHCVSEFPWDKAARE
jgi:hypothetical protein